MSYARMGPDSDVYVYGSVNGSYECCMCSLSKQGGQSFDCIEEVLDHLKDHKAAGHKVPGYCIDRLVKELADERDS